MNIKAILDYQEADRAIRAQETEIERSEQATKAREAQMKFKDAKEVVDKCDKEAQVLISYYNKAKVFFEENTKKVEELNERIKEASDNIDTEKLKGQLNQLLDKFAKIERDLAHIQKKTEEITSEFAQASKKGAAAKNEYIDNKQKYDDFRTSKAAEIEALKAKLKSCESQVDKGLLEKYNNLRKDKVFPIFVPFEEPRSCGGCRMELSMGITSKLKEQGTITCEHCRRIVYYNK